ncbi:ubiquitin carboxyl-terminal hydrolase [Anaeramoeba flamelloides]|uniref:ubiquitinyl hydrolase 1 n=1 Tax=Anaeramoeba flamelloides TaxID=1746091 RepID=A0AAV7YXI4_9EUKA|nr:ubiquitin carboxyl-terminal hydrolase [Anaeramoeba flamelloides]
MANFTPNKFPTLFFKTYTTSIIQSISPQTRSKNLITSKIEAANSPFYNNNPLKTVVNSDHGLPIFQRLNKNILGKRYSNPFDFTQIEDFNNRQLNRNFSTSKNKKKIKKKLPQNKIGHVGFKNLDGVSCYKNASLQCLLKTPLILLKNKKENEKETQMEKEKEKEKEKQNKNKNNQNRINSQTRFQNNQFFQPDTFLNFPFFQNDRNLFLQSISNNNENSNSNNSENGDYNDPNRNKKEILKIKKQLKKQYLVSGWLQLVDQYQNANNFESIDHNVLKKALRKLCPEFLKRIQQDAHEFLTFFLDTIFEETKDRNGHCFVSDIFSGELTASLQCSNCTETTLQKELVHNLSIPLPAVHNKKIKNFHKPQSVNLRNNKRINSKLKDKVNLEDCINLFFEKNILQDNDSVWCSKCKKKTKHFHQYQLTKLPNILIIHLLRFDYQLNKNPVTCKFPITEPLDLSNLIPHCKFNSNSTKNINNNENNNNNKKNSNENENFLYDLIGVIHHSGTTRAGHYTASTLDQKNNTFYYFNDSRVRKITDNSKILKNAYILFYQKKKLTL